MNRKLKKLDVQLRFTWLSSGSFSSINLMCSLCSTHLWVLDGINVAGVGGPIRMNDTYSVLVSNWGRYAALERLCLFEPVFI